MNGTTLDHLNFVIKKCWSIRNFLDVFYILEDDIFQSTLCIHRYHTWNNCMDKTNLCTAITSITLQQSS